MRLVLWIAGAFALFSLLLIFLGEDNTPSSSTARSANTQPAVDRPAEAPELTHGAADARVTLVKYMDFKCPLCNSLHQNAMQEIDGAYIESGDVRVVYRNLASLGPDSPRAAQGAYCALEQELFHEYQDTTYAYMWDNYYSQGLIQEGEFSDVLTTDVLRQTFSSVGGDGNAFVSCLEDETYAQLVEADRQLASRDGVRGTPSVVAAGEVIVGAQPFSIYRTFIESLL